MATKHPIVICVCCHEAILPSEPMLETIHGYYHDRPKTCQDGREDYKDD